MSGADATKINGPQEGAVEPADKPLTGLDSDNSSALAGAQAERVRVYVDGFNLYYGLHDKYDRRYLWLDLRALATRYLRDGQVLTGVHYFTARRRTGEAAKANQAVYLQALKLKGVEVVEGRFQEKPLECRSCGAAWTSYEEKQTDVNLCLRLLEDAVEERFDVAMLISADSDMVPAIRSVRRLRRSAKVIAMFPPARYSEDLKRAVHSYLRLSEARIRQSQLPQTVYGPGGTYNRPKHWT